MALVAQTQAVLCKVHISRYTSHANKIDRMDMINR